MKKYIIFIFILLLSCEEDPEVAKQKKLDKSIEELHEKLKPEMDKIAGLFDSLKSYSEMMSSPEVQKYRRLVEDTSKDYFDQYLKEIPKDFKYKAPVKTDSFVKFQNMFSSYDHEYKDIQGLYEEVLKSKNYLKFDDAIKDEIKIVDEVIKVLSVDFEWYHENLDSSLKELGHLRQIAKALKYKALIEVAKGEFEQVKIYIKRLNDFATSVEGIKGSLMVRLVANSLQHINYSTLYEIIEKDLLTTEQFNKLRTFQKTLKKPILSNYSYFISLELYRDLLWCSASKLEQQDYILLDLKGMLFFDEDPQATLDWIKQELEKPGKFNQLEYLKESVEFFNSFLKDVQNRVPARKLSCSKVLTKLLSKKPKSVDSELRRIIYNAYPKIALKNHIVWTRYEICEFLLALKVYERENNTLPESMNELLGKDSSVVPMDYYTGRPVKYIKDQRVIIIKAAHGSDVEIKF